MADFALGMFQRCTASYHDDYCLQLQLLRTAEPSMAAILPSLYAGRKNRPCIVVPANPFMYACVCSAFEPSCQISLPRSTFRLQNQTCAQCVCGPLSLLDPCEGRNLAFGMLETWGYPRKKNSARFSIVCATAQPNLDGRSNDTSPNGESSWREEVLSALRRSLLESQWALQSAQSVFEDLKPENSNSYCQQKGTNTAVRSGQASARKRRLFFHSKSSSQNKEDILRASGFIKPVKPKGKTKKGKFKVDPLQDFVSSFLRPTNGNGMLTKEQERGLTRQMRICQSLEKAKRELKERFGHDPSDKIWAKSVHISTVELLSMVSKGELARNKMLYSHLRLVVAVAKHYQNLGVDMNDLIQEGSKGLLRGLEKFDHRKGCKLSTYVHWWIRQGMTRAIADHSRLLRVPVYLHEIKFAIRGAKASLTHQGKPVTVENLSQLLNVPNYKVERALKAKNRLSSLDRSRDTNGLKMDFNGLHEFVADQNRENQPWDLVIKEDMIANIRNRMTLLTSKEQKIIRWIYGIDMEGGVQSTLTAVGEKLGVSKERVRQIRDRALSKMQRSEKYNSA